MGNLLNTCIFSFGSNREGVVKYVIPENTFSAMKNSTRYIYRIRKLLEKKGFDLKRPIARTYSYEDRGMVYTQDEDWIQNNTNGANAITR